MIDKGFEINQLYRKLGLNTSDNNTKIRNSLNTGTIFEKKAISIENSSSQSGIKRDIDAGRR